MKGNPLGMLGIMAALAAAPRRSVPYGDMPPARSGVRRISAMFAGSKKKARAAHRKAEGRRPPSRRLPSSCCGPASYSAGWLE